MSDAPDVGGFAEHQMRKEIESSIDKKMEQLAKSGTPPENIENYRNYLETVFGDGEPTLLTLQTKQDLDEKYSNVYHTEMTIKAAGEILIEHKIEENDIRADLESLRNTFKDGGFTQDAANKVNEMVGNLLEEKCGRDYNPSNLPIATSDVLSEINQNTPPELQMGENVSLAATAIEFLNEMKKMFGVEVSIENKSRQSNLNKGISFNS